MDDKRRGIYPSLIVFSLVGLPSFAPPVSSLEVHVISCSSWPHGAFEKASPLACRPSGLHIHCWSRDQRPRGIAEGPKMRSMIAFLSVHSVITRIQYSPGGVL
jgi:hypothetical protein